jgi:urea transport system substrate-binding protein
MGPIENRPTDDDPRLAQTQAHDRESGADDSGSRAHASTHGFAVNTGSDPTGGVRLEAGSRIGRYQIIGTLGAGGMGIVYQAHDSVIDRDVAVKVLSQDMAANATALRRFVAEARAAGKLSHANAVAIYEVGQDGETHYLVMEFVPGGSVASRLQCSGAFSVLEATRITADACKGLAAAHEVGMIHRDIKPANLLFARDGTVKVADFGLAKPALSETRQITQAGQIVGSPYFMSPEQCESSDVDYRSDIYSMGATYYSLLTGVNPYEGAGSTVQVMYAHCHADLPDPRKVTQAVPDACAEIIARAMAKRREDRYLSAQEMLADLNAVIATLSGVAGIQLPSQSGTRAAISATRAGTAPTSGHRRVSRRVAAGAIVLIAVFLAALVMAWRQWSPDQSDADDHRSAAGGPSAVAPSGLPIKVGILNSMTGTMAESGSAVIDATLLAIDEVNQLGGVLGRPVQPIVKDGCSDSVVFAREAEKLIANDKVIAIFGCWTSSGRKMVVPVVERHNSLLLYPVQYEGMEESPNVIYLGATPNQQLIPAVKWAYAFLNKRRFFLVGSDYVFPRAANEVLKDHLKELGAETVGEAYLPLGGADAKPVVAQILQAKPDVILNTINGDSNVAFFRELRAAGIHPNAVPTISFSIGEEELRHLNVPAMAGD